MRRLRGSQTEEHGCAEGYGGEEDGRAGIISGSDSPPAFQAPAHDLYPVTPFVSGLVVADGLGSGFAPWEAERDPLRIRLP